MRHDTFVRRNAAALGFAGGVAAIWTGVLFALSASRSLSDPAPIAWAATFDLTVGVPLLYWLLMVRRKGWPLLTVVPVFLLTTFLAGRLIAEAHQGPLQALELVVIPLELFIIAFVIWKVRGALKAFREGTAEAEAHGGDFHDAARATVAEIVPFRGPADAVANEISIFHYALAGWRGKAPTGDRSFSYHRENAYITLAVALLMVMFVELFAVHALVHVFWSGLAAWILTGLTVYGIVRFVADLHAIRLRPIRVEDDRIVVRIGLRWSVDIPRDRIASVQRLGRSVPEKAGDYLAAVPIGAPTFLVTMTEPIVVDGPYGIRKTVRRIGLPIDDCDRFAALCEDPPDDGTAS